VRNLAQRSAQAARSTAELIEGTVARVKNGSEIAGALETGFKDIEDGAQDVGKMIADITMATSEQATGVDQVNVAVAQIDKVTQENAASAEECASASEELTSQAGELKTMVGDLVVVVSGRGGRAVKASAVRHARKARDTIRNAVATVANAPRAIATAGAQTVMRPSDVIPLGGDDDF
jgi:methyl-accepting chemotaxis protein